MFAQFFVANGKLSCQMYQRSADLGLGVPFNIASYALLTCIFARLTGLQPGAQLIARDLPRTRTFHEASTRVYTAGEFVHTIGDAHVYLNHVDALREQLKCTPRPFPTLTISERIAAGDPVEKVTFDDLKVDGYDPYPKIKMDMAV